MFLLEKHTIQYLKVMWNVVTLEQYLHKEMISRGLRMKKNPTFSATEDFTCKWNAILSNCSFKLIELILAAENDKITEIYQKIEETTTIVESYSDDECFQDMQKKLMYNLELCEKDIMSLKKRKFD